MHFDYLLSWYKLLIVLLKAEKHVWEHICTYWAHFSLPFPPVSELWTDPWWRACQCREERPEQWGAIHSPLHGNVLGHWDQKWTDPHVGQENQHLHQAQPWLQGEELVVQWQFTVQVWLGVNLVEILPGSQIMMSLAFLQLSLGAFPSSGASGSHVIILLPFWAWKAASSAYLAWQNLSWQNTILDLTLLKLQTEPC